ncbi:MAG TPA: isoleucine--tRNA ligase [Stellaceae bacterium]|nr:isoleucine--tRNA ligase [Stellaceae bacterium]
MAKDYRDTVFLPNTDFPMKAALPQREPQLLERWRAMNLWEKQRARSKGRPKFILHDGPPYANGGIHLGTALNKILKDIVNRTQQMMGKDAVYVPGWDCHGLPIEWKIEEEYRDKKRKKEDVPVLEFRQECRAFAQNWVNVQSAEFQRLGVLGDWAHPYMTMTNHAEAQIMREIGKFVMNGGLYRGARPIMWSVVEQTALAEAEVEYHDHVSTTVWVKFPVAHAAKPELKGASIVIWTTTPWTLPGNRAIAYGAEMDYVLVEITHAPEGGLVKIGDRIVVSLKRWPALEQELKIGGIVHASFIGRDLAGTVARHPLHGKGYDFDVTLLPGDFVTDEDGTGFVHIAPGHGADDFVLGRKHNIPVPDTVAGDGSFLPQVPLFAGKRVFRPNGKEGDANGAVIAALIEAGALLGQGKLTHSYPHSWRSKAPLIFRTTPQWFISMETNHLRDVALKSIDATQFFPPQGRNRIRSMIETRPDWCISRQRAWGVPIAVFVDKGTGEVLRDQDVIDRIAAAFEKGGADRWYDTDPRQFLGPDRDPSRFEQVTDIVDVWFESGSTHGFVLEERADLRWPADLYLEGSDQHRGWFHSSLLESCGTRGRAPFNQVLTHGFVLDEQGRKMSKSLGNMVVPQEVAAQNGAEILRLWVVNSDFTADLNLGPEILKRNIDAYRRFRNTLRYLLGALGGFSAAERVAPDAMPELERWVLHRLTEIDAAVREAAQRYDFHAMFTALHNFCAVDLSAFYFDVRKDSLYCDAPTDPRRRAARTVLDIVFDRLARWLAPILCFTAEEAWLTRHGDGLDASVHLETFADVPAAWRDDALGKKYASLRELRRVVTGAIEKERAEKRIGSSLQAAVTIHAGNDIDAGTIDLAEFCIVSDAALSAAPPPANAFTLPDVPGIGVVVSAAPGEKCQRCWRVLSEVGHVHDHPDLCGRCADAVEKAA